MPTFFHVKVYTLGSFSVAFVFVDTNLFNYGYTGDKSEPVMLKNFQRNGWVAKNNAIELQLNWIQKTLEKHADKDYLFVVGHHNLGTTN
jgi:tartrate-resistant acid phosphatase type 5